MEEYDLELEHHVKAATATMRGIDPDRAEHTLKELFGAGSSAWTGWDEQFVTFIETHRRAGLLYGTVGDGWHFLFSPSAGKGFWVCSREGMIGKGFLRPKGVAGLTEIAVQKHLFTR
ncbi:MAG: hypothetical protein RLZZ505_2281 [Verrucomicrobiota bacterium]